MGEPYRLVDVGGLIIKISYLFAVLLLLALNILFFLSRFYPCFYVLSGVRFRLDFENIYFLDLLKVNYFVRIFLSLDCNFFVALFSILYISFIF